MNTVIYIVTWTIASFVYDPCPDYGKKNEYGLSNASVSCAVLHGHYEHEEMSKTFSTKDSAVAFIENGWTPATLFSLSQRAESFKLDSIINGVAD